MEKFSRPVTIPPMNFSSSGSAATATLMKAVNAAPTTRVESVSMSRWAAPPMVARFAIVTGLESRAKKFSIPLPMLAPIPANIEPSSGPNFSMPGITFDRLVKIGSVPCCTSSLRPVSIPPIAVTNACSAGESCPSWVW